MTKSTYLIDVVSGNAPSGAEVIHKFGRNEAVGTTYAPVAFDGIYRTPQAAGATTLRIKAGGNAGDTAAGAGAQEVTIEGINASGQRISETLATAGASASSSTSQSFMRVFRAYVSASGTYGTISAGSHVAEIAIENTAGTEDWAILALNTYPRAQTEIAAYTIPEGKTGYIMSMHYTVDTTKTTSLLLLHRENILDTAAPYSAVREILSLTGIAASGTYDYEIPLGPFEEFTDIFAMAAVSATTSEISMTFELLLKDKE